jgi:predicted phosphodiesterase
MRTIVHFFHRIIKFILTRPVTWIAGKVSSSPKKEKVMASLSKLYEKSMDQPGEKGGNMFSFNPREQSIIIFSDQHKGARNGADDFAVAADNYMAALDYYDQNNFFYVNLGDSEELWENSVFSVIKHNKDVFEKEKLFVDKKKYCKIIGNHDLFWKNDPFAQVQIKKIYNCEIKIYEGIVLRMLLKDKNIDIFCTHGHQGDAQSDGNWFSKWFVSYIWGPLQAFLEINTNNPAANNENKTLHNQMMYEWSIAQKNILLITGHTHQPVFNSLTHLERLYLQLEEAQELNDTTAITAIENEIPKRKREYDFINHSYRNMNPSYFNTGCCCFKDGNITGIEISGDAIRLIKWSKVNGVPKRFVAEESSLSAIAEKI